MGKKVNFFFSEFVLLGLFIGIHVLLKGVTWGLIKSSIIRDSFKLFIFLCLNLEIGQYKSRSYREIDDDSVNNTVMISQMIGLEIEAILEKVEAGTILFGQYGLS